MTGERIDLGGPSRRPPVPRLLLLVGVMLCVAWLFTWHFGNVSERMVAGESIRDETGTLTPAQTQLLRDAGRVLNEVYGLRLRVLVRSQTVSAPAEPDPKTLFIGLDTVGRRHVLVLPPLLAKALPRELVRELTDGELAAGLNGDDWPRGLNRALLAILEALRDHR